MGQQDLMNLRRPSASQYQYHTPPENGNGGLLQGPRRVVCFCLLAVLLPCVLVSVALLMRFVVHGNYIYHLSPSDMRILDQRISTIWCQSEKVTGNTSFTGYITEGEPELVESTEPQIIQRNLIVPDDHKEYWGFYLLKGSTFRIHTCARWKGGTLLIVRGRSHLEHCAYIGEADSAGDSDQFSASGSGEVKPPGPLMVSRPGDNPLYNSKEEISVILSKIRQYIRSRPKNYQKLKKNLADWMLLESTKGSQEQKLEPHKTNATTNFEIKEINFNSNNSSTSIELDDSNFRNSNVTKEVVEGDKLKMEHGTIERHRRTIEIRKASESGENGAFENNDNSLENQILIDEKVIEKKVIDKSKSLGSIWETANSHHNGILNSTDDPNDGSDSESESSWSSSEEAMAKCEGVLALFNILPSDKCGLDLEEGSEVNNNRSDRSNANEGGLFPYYEGKVNVSGYYYFIFGSENEKQDNLIRARFELDKFIYNLPEPMENCTNVRECRVDFKFASNQKLVILVPQPPPNLESIWDEVYVLESQCEPRTSLYLIFVLTVPLVILLCAFQ